MWNPTRASLNLLWALALLGWTPALGAETAILNVTVNQEGKGDYFVLISKDRKVLLRLEDLIDMGLREPDGRIVEVDGEPYMDLGTMRGITFTWDDQSLTLDITALPYLLGKQTIDLSAVPSQPPPLSTDPGGFVNYRLDYRAEGISGLSQQRFVLTHQIGLQKHNLLFLSDATYSYSDSDNPRWVRLMSHLTYDIPPTRQRWVFWDFFTPAHDIGGSLNLGGISVQKAFFTDPYFIQNPTIDLSGTVSLPSEMDVYVDGVPIRRERISPGEFELRNLSTREGAGLVEVVLTDPFGREQRLRFPFYLATSLLKEGLHDYGYHLGFMREQFGMESFEYGSLVFSAVHRYGFYNGLTGQWRTEATSHRFDLGPSVAFGLRQAGVVNLSGSLSRDRRGRVGWAASLRHSYQREGFYSHLLTRRFSPDYSTLLTEDNAERIRSELSAGLGYGRWEWGTVSLDYSLQDKYRGEDRQEMALGFSRTLWNRLNVLTTFRITREVQTEYAFFIGLHYYPGRSVSLSTSYERRDDDQRQILQAQKQIPTGEGWGGRMVMEGRHGSTGSQESLHSFGQVNTAYGIYTAEYRHLDQGQYLQLSAAGGLAYIGGHVGLSRPITDSFALVQVDRLPGVRVYQNNREMGRTDASGSLFLPNVSPYVANQISIDDRDIPLNYGFDQTLQIVALPYRGGTHLRFEANPFQAVFGRMTLRVEGEERPVDLVEFRISGPDGEILFPTSRDGEFYVENLSPGRYRAETVGREPSCGSDILIPETKEVFIDLGDLLCLPAQ